MKAIRIFLLVLIIIGLGLIATQSFWVPKLVGRIMISPNSIPQLPTSTSTKSSVYRENRRADTPTSYTALNGDGTLFKDQTGNVYTYDNNDATYASHPTGLYTLVPGVDTKTFIFVATSTYTQPSKGESETFYTYYKDKNAMYLLEENEDMSGIDSTLNKITGADPTTFSIIGPGFDAPYAKDNKSVFYGKNIIAGADVATFSLYIVAVDPLVDAKDKNHEYSRGEIIQDKCGSCTLGS